MDIRAKNIEKRRQRILACAREIIASDGPEELNMRALAKRAGLSVTTLYNLFGSKDEIILALVRQGVSSVQPAILGQSTTDPMAALQSMAVSPAAHLVENADLFKPMIRVGLYQSAGRDPGMQALYGFLIGAIEGVVKTAQDAGVLLAHIPARLLASQIFYSFRVAVEDWGCGLIEDGALTRRMQSGLYFVLLVAASGKTREELQKSLQEVQQESLADLAKLFPGLSGDSAANAAAIKRA